jgi:hypothetical protein
MSAPSGPRPPDDQGTPAQPTTQEIPIVAPAAAPPLPPHPAATPQAPVAPTATERALPAQGMPAQPTGPVGFVPGLGAPPPPPPAAPATTPAGATPAGATAVSGAPTWPDTLEPDAGAAARPPKERTAKDPAAFAGIGVAVLAFVLLELGLVLGFGTRSLWSAIPLWSAFATVTALLALLVFVAGPSSGSPAREASGVVRGAAAGGLAGVAVFWLLVVLPDAASNRGFVLTAALACLLAGVWIGRRRRP